jgi:hypothetical protein
MSLWVLLGMFTLDSSDIGRNKITLIFRVITIKHYTSTKHHFGVWIFMLNAISIYYSASSTWTDKLTSIQVDALSRMIVAW